MPGGVLGGIAQFISRHSQRVRWGTRLPPLPAFGLIKNFLSPYTYVVQDREDPPTPPKGPRQTGSMGGGVVQVFTGPGVTLHPDPQLPLLV